jgi:hypothetical protein
MPEMGTGRDIWESMVKPRRETPRSLVSQALLSLALTDRLPMDGSEATADWPGVSVAVRLARQPAGNGLTGTAVIGYIWKRPPTLPWIPPGQWTRSL